jgi:hypothetical protein
MNLVLSVDPGLWKSGCALWDNRGMLLRAWTARHKKVKGQEGPVVWRKMALAIDADPTVLVMERMQVDGRTRGREKGLLELSGVVGALSLRFGEVEVVSYTPNQWKGNLPKTTMQARLQSKLLPEELAVVCPRATHDAWDAIGIGAYYFRTEGVNRWQRKTSSGRRKG